MRSKKWFAGMFILMLYACDNNEQAQQQQVPAKQETAVVAELAATTEAMPAASAKPESPAEPAVAQTVEPLSGEAVYKKTCMACHDSGAAGAPKIGDKQAWKPRIEKGMDALMQSALNGVPGTSMMKRGTCLSCSDEDLKAAIDYMVSKSQ